LFPFSFWALTTTAFPKGWYDGSIILVQSSALDRKEGKFASFWSFLQPFHYTVWLLIGAATIFTGLMYFMLERLNVESDERELEHQPVTAIFLASMVFTGHFQFQPNTNPARILSFSWTFWALIITSAYTANMASFLVSRNAKDTVVATLEDALKKGTPVCIQRFSVMDDVIAKKYPEMNLVRKDTEREIFDALRQPHEGGQGGCRATLSNLGTFALYQGNHEVNHDCTLRSERRIIQHMPSGFATGVDTGNLCTSLISYVINIHMTKMISDGFVADAWEKHIKKISTKDCQATSTTSMSSTENPKGNNVSLDFMEMAGIFVLHLALLCFAVLVAFSDLRKCIRTSPPARLPVQ
jgi:Ligand-gated ion channel